MNIYQSGDADNLTDPYFFTKTIQDYQAAEENLLQSMMQSFTTVIEAGCTKGRHTELVTSAGKTYIGIDIGAHHIADASLLHKDNKQALFFCSDIHQLQSILFVTCINAADVLLVFPFNAFGNIEAPYEMLEHIKEAGIKCIIFTYATNETATQERMIYYETCGFEDIKVQDETDGIRFINDMGLNTIAYNEKWFFDSFEQLGFYYRSRSFGRIGRAYCNF